MHDHIHKYWMMSKPDHHSADKKGRVLAHRYLFEQYNKCSLLPWSNVHHIDGNGKNNNPNNLLGMTTYQHKSFEGKLHRPKMDMSKRVCTSCNSNKTSVWHWIDDKLNCHTCYIRWWRYLKQ